MCNFFSLLQTTRQLSQSDDVIRTNCTANFIRALLIIYQSTTISSHLSLDIREWLCTHTRDKNYHRAKTERCWWLHRTLTGSISSGVVAAATVNRWRQLTSSRSSRSRSGWRYLRYDPGPPESSSAAASSATREWRCLVIHEWLYMHTQLRTMTSSVQVS